MNELQNMDTGHESAVAQRTAELEKEFSYDGYQVVRKELFAHLRDPAIVIRKGQCDLLTQPALTVWRMSFISI